MVDRSYLEPWQLPPAARESNGRGAASRKGRPGRSEWALQDAKARLSQLIRAAEREPQIITYRGVPTAEVRSLKSGKKPKVKTLLEVLQSCPKVPEFKLPPRKREKPRKIF
jgi:prevent-host-death family protein